MTEEAGLFIPDIQYLVYRECPVDWRLKPHLVSDYDITYIVGGKARYTINGIRHELQAGSILCLPEGTRKEAVTYPDHRMHCFSVNFKLKDTAGRVVVPPFPLVKTIGIRDDIIRFFHELIFTWLEKQPGYTIKSGALELLVLHRLYELTVYHHDSTVGDIRIQQSIRYIAQNYTKPLTVKKLAALAGLNAAYFGVLFKQETGLTVHQYLAKTRIRNAGNLLQSGAYRVAEAAEACGYGDIYHFYKQFKAIMGMPPSQCIPRAKT
ncbi:MAG: AraC family transcriptional regulator [Treponema sp.]|jgi:AraC-like DNA-binding protein|nr:AraC family transcriptional regulator [Treponema sp.]